MERLLTLPTGEAIRPSTISAIRLGDYGRGEYLWENQEWRVLIDHMHGPHALTCIVECDSKESRDALAAELRDAINNGGL